MRSYSKKRERKETIAAGHRGLRHITVRARPGNRSQGFLSIGTAVFPCALGRGGISSAKREGDGATPLARMRILSGYVRRTTKTATQTRLPLSPISADLGWCEVPDDRNYNRPVRLPYAASHEHMLRADTLYDYCLVLDWNISPDGGAAAARFSFTFPARIYADQGCVAVTMAVMRRLLPHLSSRTVLEVKR